MRKILPAIGFVIIVAMVVVIYAATHQDADDTDVQQPVVTNTTVNVTLNTNRSAVNISVRTRYPDAMKPLDIDGNDPVALFDAQVLNIRKVASVLGLHRTFTGSYPEQFEGALDVLEASCAKHSQINCNNFEQTNFIDVYTGQPYDYRTRYGTYLMTYELHFPSEAAKKDTPFLLEGTNTMDPQFLSIEMVNNDHDTDGLLDEEERYYGTKATYPDTDGDGASDFDEVRNGSDAGKAWDYPFCIENIGCFKTRAEYERALAQ